MLKEELEAAIRSDGIWSGRSTLVLAIGILGEYVLLPFLEDRPHWKKWKLAARAGFAFLVVAGIVGEYAFSERISQNASRLQTISDEDLASANDSAARALSQLADANRKAGEANQKAAEANARSENLEGSNKRLAGC